MYLLETLPKPIVQWLVSNALNELNAFLCEVDPHEQNGEGWLDEARAIASRCRSVAAVATADNEKFEWLELAKQFEETI